MKLKVTYRRASGADSEIVVVADASASVGDVARQLLDADPVSSEKLHFSDKVTLAVALPGAQPVPLPPDRAIGEAQLASGFDVRVVDAVESAADGAAAALLRIESGPGQGQEFVLRAGSTSIGREPGSDVVIHDQFMSKRHARIEVTPSAGGTIIEVVDLNSANGIVLDGAVISRVRALPGQVFEMGSTKLTVSPLQQGPGTGRALDIHVGSIGFTRSPRVEERYPAVEHPRPRVPSKADRRPFPWIMLFAPILMGSMMYTITRSPTSLVIVAMAPIMLIGNFVMSRGSEKQKLADEIGRFDTQLDRLQDALATEIPRERELRQREVPPVADIFQAGLQHGPLLWTRRPEHWNFLHVRFGSGSLPSRNTIAKADSTDDGLPEYADKLDFVADAHRTVEGVPVLEDLLAAGAVGVVGDHERASDAARGLLLQLTGLHSPAELVVTAMASPQEVSDHAWLAWMPHTSSPQSPIVGPHLADSAATTGPLLNQLEELVATRLADKDADFRGPLASELKASGAGGRLDTPENDGRGDRGADVLPVVVALITEGAPADRARLVQLSERAVDAGVIPLWVSSSADRLPAVCRTFIDVSAGLEQSSVHFVRHGQVVTPVHVEGVSIGNATRFALSLAALVDEGAVAEDSSDLPRSVPLVTLLGDNFADSPESVVDRWQQNLSIHDRRTKGGTPRPRAGNLRALVGHGGVDAMHLDLRLQGPHALVGGTTGSGKSEFLQAWVLGMAAEFSPDRVTFLFVDYKGGAAFADCVHLPHCVGLVTDLSPHLVRRALTSLRAELHHREHLLNAKKAKDLLELEKRGDPECPPALVLVIDEFAALASEVPEFVDGVVDIAQRGRSLGIHLIMATQRPAGVIKDNLRANTNLRVALRMADESDSTDVIGTKEAAAFDPSIPGRGVAKTGPGRLQPFQSAYAGGRTSATPPRPTIDVHQLGFGAEKLWERPATDKVDHLEPSGPTDQQRLVRSISRAAMVAEIPPARRPWLDELSKAYDLVLLGPRTDSELLLGVADLPHAQAQEVIPFRPDVDGNLAIYGTGGSGKSVVLRTLAAGAGVTPRGGPVHVYGLDFAAGGLRMLERLPHVGAIIGADDTERVARLFRTLRAVADERARVFPEVGAGSIVDYRRIAQKPDEPRILLLVDGFPAFRDQWEVGTGRAQWYSIFQQLLSEGRALGIHVVFTADRPGSVPGAVASSVPRRVVLRLSDEGMYHMLDADPDVLSATSPPGRAVVDGLETQIAILGGKGNVADQSEAFAKLAAAIERQGGAHPVLIESLGTEIPQSSMPDRVGALPVLGVGDETMQPIGFEPSGAMLIGGGPQSGRSNALKVLARSVRRWDPDVFAVYFGNRRSVLPQAIEWDKALTDPTEIADYARELAKIVATSTSDRYLVVVESLPDFASPPTDMALVELIKAIKRSDHLLIAEAETSSWSSAFPIFTEIKNARRGLLLQPDPAEGDVIMRTTFPRALRSEFPPGRGNWVAGGKVHRVQLPLADS
ncbi:DNA segregation ATPase FtsK/SpoIIIE, S-DNA-T family [Nocardioides terrae]|uniref:DNA segregation ATPase FtsK/SpoIIIE, S-DNA-T family n=1 Tax=Nocardioides terrae TaxID=574651 RepID=A0A1I1MJN4_9ACTN|nr:FtsK/SpoIIIE domain-containing protein [Nocardioides terrae]SFC85325.1 DNA segregation ATPase FtsK/SpoIIIE, S-DNA-T family [Nocardioides terrae]